MKKAELMELVGEEITVVLFDGKEFTGKLIYAKEFSEKYGFRKPGLFYIKKCRIQSESFEEGD